MTTHTRQDVAQLVKRVQSRHHRLLDAALAQRGLSLVQWDALRALDRQPDATLHDLAISTFQSDQGFGTLAARMVDRGLVTRTAGQGRAVHLVMTDRGRELLAEGHRVVDEVLTDTLGPLSERQLQQLGVLLTRLATST